MSVAGLRDAIRSSVVRDSDLALGTTDALADPHWELRQALLVLLAADGQTLWLIETLGTLARIAHLHAGLA